MRYTAPVRREIPLERTREVFCVGPEYAGSTYDSGSYRPGSIPGGPTENVFQAGYRIPVVRIHGVDADWVQFPVARPK